MDGKEEYELRQRIDRLGWRHREMEESIKRTDANLENLRLDIKFTMKCQQEDHEAFIKYVSEQAAAARVLAETARKVSDENSSSATGKQLYIAAIGVAATVIGVGVTILSQIH